MINLRETCVFPVETQGLYSTARVHNFFRPGRNGNSVGSEVTHRPMAAEINRCRLLQILTKVGALKCHYIPKTTLGVTNPYVHFHYNDAIMGAIASQITSLTIVFSTVYLDTNQRKHQSSASLAFVRGIHRRPVNSPHKWPVTRKMFPFDDVIMCRIYGTRCVQPGTTSMARCRVIDRAHKFKLRRYKAAEDITSTLSQSLCAWFEILLSSFVPINALCL